VKIGILGGTGQFGQGLALRWAKNHEIIIGSRDPAKAIQLSHYEDDQIALEVVALLEGVA